MNFVWSAVIVPVVIVGHAVYNVHFKESKVHLVMESVEFVVCSL